MSPEDSPDSKPKDLFSWENSIGKLCLNKSTKCSEAASLVVPSKLKLHTEFNIGWIFREGGVKEWPADFLSKLKLWVDNIFRELQPSGEGLTKKSAKFSLF